MASQRNSDWSLNCRLSTKSCRATFGAAAEQHGEFLGVAVDERDGFIHFSTASQLAETAAKHFADQDNLVLVAIEDSRLAEKLKYEPSRGGDLFPHLYGTFRTDVIAWVKPMPLGVDGTHKLPLDATDETP